MDSVLYYAFLALLRCTSFSAIFSGNQTQLIKQNSTVLVARPRRFLQPELDGSCSQTLTVLATLDMFCSVITLLYATAPHSAPLTEMSESELCNSYNFAGVNNYTNVVVQWTQLLCDLVELTGALTR